jgi:hypothetical protein
MRLTFAIFCLVGILGSACSKNEAEPETGDLEVSPGALDFDVTGQAKIRKTGELFTGSAVQRNSAGSMVSSVQFKNGRRNGLSRDYHLEGTIKNEAEMKDDKLHGRIVEWFASGQKKREGQFENGIPVGVFHEWDEEDRREWQLEAIDGKLGDKRIVRNDDLKLEEKERKYLWDTEHYSTLMRKHGFGPIVEPLKSRQDFLLASVMAKGFVGQVPKGNSGIKRNLGEASASRWAITPEELKKVGADGFKEWLRKELSVFSDAPKLKLHLMTFAPMKRDMVAGKWEGRVKLHAWGKGISGGPEELTLYMDWELDFPNEKNLKAGGWLHECHVAIRKHASSNKPLMRNVADEVGLPISKLHDNWNHGPDKTNTNTGGVFACDFNRDGITDMLVTDKVPGPMPSSLRHYFLKGTRDGRMVDVTAEVGLGNTHIAVACFVDLDGDGWVDLVNGQGRIFQNVKGQHFKEIKTNLVEAGDLLNHRNGAGITCVDYNRDGKMDLYIFRSDVNRLKGTWVDGKIGPGAANQLLRNLGNWRFEDVTAATGTNGGLRSTFTSVWLNADNDNWPDLYVINEYGNGVLLTNQGRGKQFKKMELTDSAADFGSMGLAAGDFDNDGNIDIYVASMYSKSGSRVIGNLRPDAYDSTTMQKLKRMVAGSQLYRNLGGTKFAPVGKKMDVVAVGWAYGPALTDLDNDGFLDIHATTGFISRTRDKPDG